MLRLTVEHSPSPRIVIIIYTDCSADPDEAPPQIYTWDMRHLLSTIRHASIAAYNFLSCGYRFRVWHRPTL